MFEKLREENKSKLEEFSKELDFICNPQIRAVTEIAICYIHPLFFKEAASSTGKHHPAYGLGDRGLLRHTRAAVNIAESLKTINSYGLSPYDFDIAIAALILHDSCKRGVHFEHEYTQHEHPLLVSQLVPSGTFYNDDLMIYQEVCEVISTHMGQWTTTERSTITLPKPKTPLQIFVHECDYLASRKFLEVENIWTEEDEKIISESKQVLSAKKPEEKMSEAQERYIKSLVQDYQDSCNVLVITPTVSGNDFSFLTKKTASGFIGKMKKMLAKNKELLAQNN